MNSYTIGKVVVQRATFIDQATGDLLDPDVLAVRVQRYDADWQPVSAEEVIDFPTAGVLIRLSLGKFQLRLPTAGAVAGVWDLRWESTGAVAETAEEGPFKLLPTRFPNPQ